MDGAKLFEIRCPAMVKPKKSKQLMKCNHLCVKVYPGSSGEAKCRHCQMVFNFYVDSQAQSMLSVRVKPLTNDKED